MADQTAERNGQREEGEDAESSGAASGDAGASAGQPARPARWRHRLATAVAVTGELMITGGVVLALFVVYSLWWTNVLANQEAQHDGNAVRESWEAAEDGNDRTSTPEYDPEDGIGFLHVPSMSDDDILVKKGTDADVLDGGVAGYYVDPVKSAMPWDDEGNFSVAAHRDGNGAKFHDIDRIEEGDAIVFETRNTWYVYRVYEILPETSKYNTDVLKAVPRESGKTQPGRYLTLTTCTPVFTSTYRYVVWAELERTERVDERRTPPAELTGG